MKVTDTADFLGLSKKNKNNKSFSKIDFLEALLKNINNKKEIKDIILHSNLTKEQKNKLLQKFLAKSINNKETTNSKLNTQELLNTKSTKQLNKKPEIIKANKPIISQLPDFNNEYKKEKSNLVKNKDLIKKNTIEQLLKKDKKTVSKTDTKEDTTFNKEELNVLSNIQTQITNVLKQEKDIVKKVKTVIIQKSINNPILQQIVKTDEFKKASSFKDLIKLSEKFNLNLVKIAVSQEKAQNKTTLNNKTALPDFEAINNIKSTKTNIIQQAQKEPAPLSKEKKESSKISLNDLLHTNKTPKTKTDNKTDNSKNTLNQLLSQEKPAKETKKDNNNSNNQLSSAQTLQSDLKPQIITAKQTIKHFASSLKEAVENYKPPVSKLTLELHPKDLGKVEVTIRQRGDNLKVQINTNNSSTINFFTTSQQELKNSLVNMGFTNINMSFNSNQDSQQKQNQNTQKYSKNTQKNEDEELIIDFSYKYA